MSTPSIHLSSGPWSTATAGLLTRDHHLTVPLDRSGDGDRWPDGTATLTVYAREITRAEGGAAPVDPTARPPLVFLQGGPGCEAPRPSADAGLGWIGAILEHYRLILVDQRGTGASTPVDRPDAGGDAAGTARLLSHMRADEIVEDCEDLRRGLGIERWSVLGQSFGGFCVTRYLSTHPESLERVLLTGGLPAVGHSIEEVYALTFQAMRARSEEFYARYPGDRARFAALVELAAAGGLTTAAGDAVGPERLRSLGSGLGAGGGMDALHHLLERDPRSWAFRYDLGAMLPFGGRNPLYAVLHESCWADGARTRWAAQRVRPACFEADPTLLTGEHVRSDFFEEDATLRPWREVAELVAQWQWPGLYDPAALRDGGVPGAAAVYVRDVYVPMTTSLETAALIPELRTWVTSEFEHDGSRSSGGGVFRRLQALATGAVLR